MKVKDIQVSSGGILHVAILLVHGWNTTGKRQVMWQVFKSIECLRQLSNQGSKKPYQLNALNTLIAATLCYFQREGLERVPEEKSVGQISTHLHAQHPHGDSLRTWTWPVFTAAKTLPSWWCWRWGYWRHVGGKWGFQHWAVSGLGPGGWGQRPATPPGEWPHHQPCHVAEEGRHHAGLLIYTVHHPTV